MKIEKINSKEIILYRLLNPESRAIDFTTWVGSSGTVRRATYIFCRATIATSSAKYKETQKSINARFDHGKDAHHHGLQNKILNLCQQRLRNNLNT